MREQFNSVSNIPSDIIKKLYVPLKETYPGSWEDFNAMMIYLGIIGSLQMWEEGLDLLSKKDETIPLKGTKERREMMAEVLAMFLDEVVVKIVGAGGEAIKKQVTDFCEDFRRTL